MKRKLIFSTVFTVACFALTGCNEKVDDAVSQSDDAVTISFGMTMPDNNTRAVSEKNGALAAGWKKDDKVTIGITHYETSGNTTISSTTYKTAIVNEVSNDGKRAYVNMNVASGSVSTGDGINVIYPALTTYAADGSTVSGSIDFTSQDGTAASLGKYGIYRGNSKLAVEGTVATLQSDMDLTPKTAAYLGIKCTTTEGTGSTPLKVKELTVRPADTEGSAAWKGWYSKSNVTQDGEASEYWGAITASLDEATTDEIYIAVPAGNSGQRMTFTAITDEGKVYTATKTWTGVAGDCYHNTLTMTEQAVPTAVDLGLSVDWASMDLGMTSAADVDNVGYYAWSEVSTRGGSWNYDWAATPYYSANEWGKYSDADGLTELQSSDDAASVTLGSGWRMPTVKEWQELKDPNNCKWEKLNDNGIVYYKVTSLKTGYTDKSIYFYNVGYRYGSVFDGTVNGSTYTDRDIRWSSSLGTQIGTGNNVGTVNTGSMWNMRYISSTTDINAWPDHLNRYYGLAIRPVKTKPE